MYANVTGIKKSKLDFVSGKGYTVNCSLPKEIVTLDWNVQDFKTLYGIAKSSQCPSDKIFAKLDFDGGKSLGIPSKWRLKLGHAGLDDISLYLQYMGSSPEGSDTDSAVASFETYLLHSPEDYRLVTSGEAKHFEKMKKKIVLRAHDKNCNITKYGQEYVCTCSVGDKPLREFVDVPLKAGYFEQWGFEKFKTLRELETQEFLSAGQLSLKIKITLYGNSEANIDFSTLIKSPNILTTAKWEEVFQSTLIVDLAKLLESGEDADYVFSVAQEDRTKDDIKIKAHKFILSARSPFFVGMFKSGMQEATSGEMKIVDASPKTMQTLLRFLYTGWLEEDWGEIAAELINVADKFALLQLMEFIDENIEKALTPANVIRLFEMAKKHELKVAQRSIKKFIKENVDQHISILLDVEGEEDEDKVDSELAHADNADDNEPENI